MSVDRTRLNGEVSGAILDAERHLSAALLAWKNVSRLEEALAAPDEAASHAETYFAAHGHGSSMVIVDVLEALGGRSSEQPKEPRETSAVAVPAPASSWWSRVVSFLHPYLKNEWMNNANVLAQIAHVGWMIAIVSNIGWRFGRTASLVTAGVLALYATVKEWVYDANFELPKQTWRDNLLDMSMLWLGILLGLAALFLPRAW